MKSLRQWVAHAGEVARLLGKKGVTMFVLGLVSSFVLSVVEYGIAVFLVLFLFVLGFVEPSEFPSWLGSDVSAASPVAMWLFLLALGMVQAAARIASYQSKIILTEGVNARLRMALGYTMLKRQSVHAMPLSEVDFYMAECFPKAAGFVFYSTQVVSFGVQAIMLCVGMFYLAWGEALVGIAGLCVMGCLVLQFNRLTARTAEPVSAAQAALERTKLRIIRNWILIRVLRIQDREYGKYLDSVFRYYRHSAAGYFFGNLGGALMPVAGIVVIGAIVLGNFWVFRTPAVGFVAFLYLFVRLQQKLSNGSNLVGGLFTYRVPFRKAVQMFFGLSPQELKESLLPERSLGLFSGSTRLDGVAKAARRHVQKRPGEGVEGAEPPDIQVRGCSFSWPEMGRGTFEGLSFDVTAGAQFGVTGPNGSGKSTLLGLMLGVYRPSSGQVLVGGVEAPEYFEGNADAIAYVGPEPYLIHGTIGENLTYGLEDHAPEEDVWQVLKIVRLDEFVRGIPGGLDYVIHENGEGLSSGQKQRLTIARALLRRPSLLVLDEPSASLDKATEGTIVGALEELKGRCTVVIVSHKPAVLGGVDGALDMGTGQVRRPGLGAGASVP